MKGELIKCRSAKNFEAQYLRKGFRDKITVVRVLDSRNEVFKLSKAYEHKVGVINIVTAPEMEMLIILSEGKYAEYKKSGKKPSDFCKESLRLGAVKNYAFVKGYFSNIERLMFSINEYQRISKIPQGEYTLKDIIRK